MRHIIATLAIAALPAFVLPAFVLHAAALAQPAPAPAPVQGGRAISRDQFIQRAAEMAGRRFDAIDTNHTGTITRAQMRAYREAHGGGRGSPAAAE